MYKARKMQCKYNCYFHKSVQIFNNLLMIFTNEILLFIVLSDCHCNYK